VNKVTRGMVDVELDGEVITMSPTLGALTKIERRFGSVRQAAEAVANMQHAAICDIITFGAGLDKASQKELPEAVFQAGLVNVAGAAGEYLAKLLNPAGDVDQDDEKKAD
jgi:hypothetical protein